MATQIKLAVGDRVRLRRAVDRFPDLLARPGMLGTVTVIERSPPSVWIRMDESLGPHVEGNEIGWHYGDVKDLPRDVEVVGSRDPHRRRHTTERRDPVRLTAQQKASLRRLVGGFGPLSYGERETARRFHAMGLIRTNSIKDPSYVTLSEAGKAALR